ncbi:MAG: nuclear transport factor 2 family protein [Candidatus Eisenbacteria bacterium]|nr:nuclear transport factor 2 family protein [Candidatus Eisenbacteria bacterium]
MFPAMLLAAACGCSGGAQQSAPAVNQAAISAAIDSANATFAAAAAAHDTAAVVACYAADAHFLPPNAPRADGKDAIQRAWAGMLAMPGVKVTMQSNTKIVSEAGDLVIDLGSYDMTAPAPKGKSMHDVGKYATTFKRMNWAWKIIVDTFNSDMRPPGM